MEYFGKLKLSVVSLNTDLETRVQAHSQLFWHFGLIAYSCLEKPPGHQFLRVREFNRSRKKVETVGYPPLTPTHNERVGVGISQAEKIGLWVGITIENAHKYRTKSARVAKPEVDQSPKPKQGDNRSKSINDLIKAGGFSLLPIDTKARQVVVDTGGAMAQMFAMSNPDENGLCQAIQVDAEEVWWAPEYRDDDETRMEQRRQKWPAKVRAAIQEILHNTTEKEVRASIYSDALVQDPYLTAAIHVARDLQEYQITGSKTILVDALRRLDDVDSDQKKKDRNQYSL